MQQKNDSQEALSRHNREWAERWRLWLKFGAVPNWWGPDRVISPSLRARYESWLPYAEFQRSLRAVARAVFPDADWMPRALRDSRYLSLPDLWAAMPPQFAGKVVFAEEEIFPFFCALADPPQFGAIARRYPEEDAVLRRYLETRRGTRVLLADIGCGSGLPTHHLAEILQEFTQDYLVSGITAEPLEVWMAQNRTIPHDARRQRQFQRFRGMEGKVRFLVGDAQDFTFEEPQNIIVCNGLVGAEYFSRKEQWSGFLNSCRRNLAPDGIIFLANHFHEGRHPALRAFATLAKEEGFDVGIPGSTGTLARVLCLRRGG
jgi:SAM-dependent methyltransferase